MRQAPGPDTSATRRPGRSSRMARSKTVPRRHLAVDGQLVGHEVFGISTAFGGADLEVNAFHGKRPEKGDCDGQAGERQRARRGAGP